MPEHSQQLVYVVDDDQGMLDSTVWLFESMGLKALPFTNGQAFLDACDPTAAACVLLDVRGSEERRAFHIGVRHIPVDELPQRLKELENGGTVLCYCQSGVRSGKAVELLRQQGFQARSLGGGLLAWLRDGVDTLEDHRKNQGD